MIIKTPNFILFILLKIIKIAKKFMKKEEACLLFKITYRCNDECPFCIAYEQRRDHLPDLSFENVIKNYEFFSKKFNISRIVFTGGEPTLHPEFVNILKYFKEQKSIIVNFVTNAINFGNKEFLEKISPLFLDEPKNKNNYLVFSANDYPLKDPKRNSIIKKRINGIINLMQSKLPLECIITISKDNSAFSHEIVKFLVDMKNKYDSNLRRVEFKMLYIEFTPNYLLNNTLPDSFGEIKLSLEKAIECLRHNGIHYYFWNLPLCYLSSPIDHKNILAEERIEKKMVMPEILIDAEHQYESFISINFQKYLKCHSECDKCSLKNCCGGIDPAYLKLPNFPELKNID